MTHRFLGIIGAGVLSMLPVALAAQVKHRTLHGEVRDTAGQPIDQVRVLALAAGRTALTGPDGRFTMDSFPLWRERFLFRRLGFNPVEATLIIDATDQEIVVRMTPIPQELDPIVVRGNRSGVFGTVTGINDLPIADVEVTVLGGAVATRTDSLGHFNLPRVPAGTFMMIVRKRGYFVVRHSVTLPVGESLDLALILAPVPPGLSQRTITRLAGIGGIADVAWDAHASRRLRCTGGDAVFVPREEIVTQGEARLDYALQRAPSVSRRGFGRDELSGYAMFIDGMDASGWPLSSIRAADVEAVEVYRALRRRSPTSMPWRSIVPSSRTSTSPSFEPSRADVCPAPSAGSVWVWLH